MYMCMYHVYVWCMWPVCVCVCVCVRVCVVYQCRSSLRVLFTDIAGPGPGPENCSQKLDSEQVQVQVQKHQTNPGFEQVCEINPDADAGLAHPRNLFKPVAPVCYTEYKYM